MTTSTKNDEPGPAADSVPVSEPAVEQTTANEKEKEKEKENESETTNASEKTAKSPKKRRKVNHACLYCRRSHMTCDTERPCTRCIKRNIGHLCHDEEPTKKAKGKHEAAQNESGASQVSPSAADSTTLEQHTRPQSGQIALGPPRLQQESIANTSSIGPNVSVSAPQAQQAGTSNNRPFPGYDDWNLGSQFQDMHNLHPSYMFNTSEVHDEYNLLNSFLSNSLMDDGLVFQGDEIHGVFSDPSLTHAMGAPGTNTAMPPPSSTQPQQQQLQSSQHHQPQQFSSVSSVAGGALARPASGFPTEKAREKYYMMAADPAGLDAPEERMNKLLKAKYDAGLLKPFNYIKGYERLSIFMKKNLHLQNQNKILRQLDRFRPQFRERMQSLTDLELIRVEMWFERCLMEYDRLFSSMAIPACCWRRTGEIFRGNKEMAELINVPIEKLRDGNIAIHDIITEDALVYYWEKFGAIAFDTTQKAILTHCSLRNPNPKPNEPHIRCCFSFTIRRDVHNIPSIIVGNFLPVAPPET